MVYGKEALLPIEVEIPSLKMLMKLTDESPDYLKERLLSLEKARLDRNLAFEHYSNMLDRNIARANLKVKDKNIQEGDLVLRYNSALDHTFKKKFQIKWEGPFKVMEKYDNGTFQLTDLDGTPHESRVNGYRLKKYVARLMTVVEGDAKNRMLTVPTLTVEEDYGPAIAHLYDYC